VTAARALRRVAWTLATAAYTAIPYWLNLPLGELAEWIETAEHEAKRD
jgi:hypothetical protein